jgi:hypothetical protein
MFNVDKTTFSFTELVGFYLIAIKYCAFRTNLVMMDQWVAPKMCSVNGLDRGVVGPVIKFT